MIYLDHNATTPCAPEVLEAILPFFSSKFGNPSSAHTSGREAMKAVEKARESVARFINASPEEIIFTAGGTESNNHAIISGIEQSEKNEIITSQIEHSAVLSVCKNLSKKGIQTKFLPTDEKGIIKAEEIANFASKNTGLITVMLVNNETGAIQPLKEIANFATKNNIIIHCDAVQAAGKIKIDVRELGVDILSISAHKFNGPKGVGALFIRRGLKLLPLLFGGSQERMLRAGTENVPGIVGIGSACELAHINMERNNSHCAFLREKLMKILSESLSDIRINTPIEKAISNTLNIGFKSVASEALVTRLDMKGICVSNGSACAGLTKTSHVLKAMNLPDDFLYSSIRISFGFSNTEEEIYHVADSIVRIVREIRNLRPSRLQN